MSDGVAQSVLGQGVDRVDGHLKVTGAARYTGDMQVAKLTYAVVVRSTIASGRLASLDTAAALAVRGVVGVISHLNALKLAKAAINEGQSQVAEANLLPLQAADIHFNGQPIALVVASSYEAAREAARLVKASYAQAPFVTTFAAPAASELPAKAHGKDLQTHRGQIDQGFQGGTVQVDQIYETPFQHHNPMEPSASLAVWSGDKLTIYDATQALQSQAKALAQVFSLKPDQVRVVSHFVGGGFGCKGATWPHSIMAALAAKMLQVPVKLVLSRSDMFFAVGHRTQTVQRVALAATSAGKLTGIRHHAKVHTSPDATFVETCVFPSKVLYACDNVETVTELYRLNLQTPTYMRAPGETPGMFALEVAMDELAEKLGMDPVQLRVLNHADVSPEDHKPFSSKHLKECYAKGAALFDWTKRTPQPRSMRKGPLLSGLGMATALYPANRSPAAAKAQMLASGHAVVTSATHDMGQGTYTVMTQIAADALALPVAAVRFELGDSSLPQAPVSGGSQTTASVGPAVADAAANLRAKILAIATADPESPLYQADPKEVTAVNGRLCLARDQHKGESYAAILAKAQLASVEADGHAEKKSDDGKMGDCKNGSQAPSCYAFYSFGAHFAEVTVNPATREIRLERLVGVYDAGRILNAKMARSQALGGMIMGLGMALMEETVVDDPSGRFITHNLADYHVPVHADVKGLDAHYLNYPDELFNPLGARGIGEISITGVAAAIANAVYHATGTRVRKLPLTLDKLLVNEPAFNQGPG